MARRKKTTSTAVEAEGVDVDVEVDPEAVPGGEAVGNFPGEIPDPTDAVIDRAIAAVEGGEPLAFTREALDGGFAKIAGDELAERVLRRRAEKELASAFRALRYERAPEAGVDYDFRGTELVPKTELAESALGFVRRVRRR